MADATRMVAWAMVLGLMGVVAISACYALSPAATVMPVVPMDLAAAMQGAVAGQSTMRPISALGMPFDVLTAAAGILLAQARFARGYGIEALGWTLAALSSFLFLIIDTIAGSVFTQLAVADDTHAFLATKILFDLLFIAGVLCLALGAILIAAPSLGARKIYPRLLAWPLALVGFAGFAASIATYAGFNFALPMGASIAVSAVFAALIAAHLARQRDA